jgi:hypothetical protein
MNKKDLDALNELYSSVYSGEQLDEAPGGPAKFWDSNMGRFVTRVSNTAKSFGNYLAPSASASAEPSVRAGVRTPKTGFSHVPSMDKVPTKTLSTKETPAQREARISKSQDAAIAAADKAEKAKSQQRQQPSGSGGRGTNVPRPAAASSTVLAKQKGVEGKLDKATGKFTAGAFSNAEKSRYSSVASRNSASSGTPKSSSSSSTSSSPKPAIGKLGNTSFERRTPTSAELRAAQAARASGASPEKALQAAQKTNLPTQGPTPAIPSASSVAADVAKANSPAVINKPAPAGTALAAQQKKPPTPGTGAIMQKQSYEWNTAKTLRDIAGAYNEIYEAKKKVDQDEDGDNDFADVRIARMIASGVPKEKAIAMTKNKSYNEDIEYIEERDEGKPGLMFKKIAASAAKRYGSKEAGNRVAGAIRKKVLANEATAMAKRGHDETAIRNKIAKSTGGGKFADKATELENRPTFGDKSKQASREKLARTQRGDFRRTTSSDYGLRLGAHKSNDPAVKAKQAARGKQRSALTPKEKKMLNREAYAAYEFVASYLLENNFASTVDDANVIINNMSEGWFNQIMEG